MLRDADELLAPAVAQAIAALKLGPEDAAAVKLAGRYAAAIDQAAAVADDAARALEKADPDDADAQMHIYSLAAKVEEKELLEKLGPKLLAALESLGASPAARARLKEGKPGGSKKPGGLAALRQAHGA
jgi:hypothetical protein